MFYIRHMLTVYLSPPAAMESRKKDVLSKIRNPFNQKKKSANGYLTGARNKVTRNNEQINRARQCKLKAKTSAETHVPSAPHARYTETARWTPAPTTRPN